MKDLLLALAEGCVLLNAEVGADNIKCDLRHVADRQNIARPMPGRLDSEAFSQDRDLSCRRKSANLREMTTDVIDQTSFNQRLPLMRIIEQLAHCNGSRAVISYLLEVFVIFRRQRVFNEERIVLLHLLAEANRLVGRE